MLAGLSLMENVLTPLAKSDLTQWDLKVAVSETGFKIKYLDLDGCNDNLNQKNGLYHKNS